MFWVVLLRWSLACFSPKTHFVFGGMQTPLLMCSDMITLVDYHPPCSKIDTTKIKRQGRIYDPGFPFFALPPRGGVKCPLSFSFGFPSLPLFSFFSVPVLALGVLRVSHLLLCFLFVSIVSFVFFVSFVSLPTATPHPPQYTALPPTSHTDTGLCPTPLMLSITWCW